MDYVRFSRLDPTWPEPKLPAACEKIPRGTGPSIIASCTT